MQFSEIRQVMNAATGKEKFDLVLLNTKFINVLTKEIYKADICIKNGRIAYVSMPGEESTFEALEYYDAQRKYACPGLIDTHVHIESSMVTPAKFAKAVIPHGTTTVLADPHEICNVIGLKGMDYFLEASENILLKVFMAAPSCVPSVVGVETSAGIFSGTEIGKMLQHDRVLSLGEVMDYRGVINQEKRMMEVMEAAKEAGKVVQGHLADVSARELAAYMIAGCESNHEARLLEEARMSLRSGMTLECRHASNYHNIAVLAQAVKELHYPENAVLCTDDREPDDLLLEGHMDAAVKEAIRAGIDPVEAIRMSTLHSAKFMRLTDRGALRPGFIADILLLDSLEEFTVNEVFVEGKLTAKEKHMLTDIEEPKTRFASENTMYMKRPLTKADFEIRADQGAFLHTITFNPEDPFLTELDSHYFESESGILDIDDNFCTMAVLERHGVNGNIGLAPIKNFGFRYGAVAGTVSHDCHNLFVIGKDADDMLIAANRLIETGGGFVCVKDKKISSEATLNICGLICAKEVSEIAKDVEKVKKDIIEMGIQAISPLNVLTAFSLAVFPKVRLTDHGIVDTIEQVKIPLFAKKQ